MGGTKWRREEREEKGGKEDKGGGRGGEGKREGEDYTMTFHSSQECILTRHSSLRSTLAVPKGCESSLYEHPFHSLALWLHQ